ncbi:mucin-21-like [Dysidea avara]|uniref:mucin-21-like n=1 Tax=Dysidea avara TaxID=196820 RepID=UPI003321F166
MSLRRRQRTCSGVKYMATLIIYMRKYLPQVVSDEATEKYNLVRRLKEEELLLVKEMSSYISFYQRIISELEDAVRVEEATLTLTSITSLHQHQGINNSDTNATNMPTSPVSSAATLTSDNSSAATLTSTNSSAATLTSDNSSAATLTSDNSSAATLTSTNSSAATLTLDNSSAATLTSTNSSATLTSANSNAATLTSDNSSASMQASTASNDVSSVQSNLLEASESDEVDISGV